ncbi:hypothetical protein GCK32_005232 [Trichostrongylus colubriformis]|uniref:Uncharacterized protein n=1 Tax=Trichostrongylus colubriformis TaxID=6319 RepID=A0AAN8G2N5_TRICO
MMMYASIVSFVFLVPCALGVGGMAELKSITGDEPYSGQGTNPPLVIPRPMGFWGRPRYSPAGYFGGSPYIGGGAPYLGGGSPYYGGGDRFTSLSYSPYGLGGWTTSF